MLHIFYRQIKYIYWLSVNLSNRFRITMQESKRQSNCYIISRLKRSSRKLKSYFNNQIQCFEFNGNCLKRFAKICSTVWLQIWKRESLKGSFYSWNASESTLIVPTFNRRLQQWGQRQYIKTQIRLCYSIVKR